MLLSVVSESAKQFVFGNTDVTRCAVCDMFGFLLVFLIAVSLHTLAALSADRFILLAWPLQYKSIVNRRRAIGVLCLIWLIGFLIALPPIVGFGQLEFNINLGACLPRFGNDPLSPYNFNYVLLVAVEALVPIFVLALTNIWTYKIVSTLLRKNFRRRKTFHEGVTVEEKREGSRHHHQQQQLVRVFAALFIAHLLCWAPVIAVVFVVSGVNAAEIPPQIYIFGWICYLTNPVLHPIIETFFVKDLRYQVRRVRSTMTDTLLRAGSTLYRKASNYAFTLEALEEANKKMDEEEAKKNKEEKEEEEEEEAKKNKEEEEEMHKHLTSSSSEPTNSLGCVEGQPHILPMPGDVSSAAVCQSSQPDGGHGNVSMPPPPPPGGKVVVASVLGSCKQISTISENLSLPECDDCPNPIRGHCSGGVALS